MDVVVDDLDIPNERQAWLQVVEDLKKPVYLRTELEVSRMMTLFTRLKYLQDLPFQDRFALTKVATYFTAPAGETLRVATGNPRLRVESPDTVKQQTASKVASPTAAAVNSASVSLQTASEERAGMFYIIVYGTVGFRTETVNGRVQSILGKGDPIGNDLIDAAVPPGSKFVALEPVELLACTMQQYKDLLLQVDEAETRARIRFFQRLIVPVLQPWGAEQYEELARAVYPLNLQSKELVVKEGNPADAAFFLREGKLKVVREIDFSTGNNFNGTLTSSAASLTNNTTAGNGYIAAVKLLELATLNEGEFFGELALLRHRVDDNAKSAGGATSIGGSMMIKANRGGNGAGGGGGAVDNFLFQDDETTITFHGGSDSDDEEDVKQITEDKAPLLRQATVYAHTPAMVYVLPRLCFLDMFRDSVLVRMREYARGYPSESDIKAHFVKQQKWEAYKAELVAQVSGSSKKNKMATTGGGANGPAGQSPRKRR